METNNWNKVLLSVFKKSQFMNTVVVDRAKLTQGYNLLEGVDKWRTKVLVQEVSDDGLLTNQFALSPGEEATVSEFQTGQYLFEAGWSNMYFRLNGYTRPFLVVSVITAWMDTHYYKGFVIAPEDLDAGADITALLRDDEKKAFPELKAHYSDNNAITIDFEGETVLLDAKERDTYLTPERKTESSTVTIYDDDHTINSYARIKIEYIP